MKTEKQNPTGPAVALKIAYDALVKLKYTHVMLRKETGLSYDTLRKIRDVKLGERSPVFVYLHMFIKILVKEYRRSFEETGGDGAAEIREAMAQILCHENYLGPLLLKEEGEY